MTAAAGPCLPRRTVCKVSTTGDPAVELLTVKALLCESALRAVGANTETAAAPGLAARLPAPVRARLASVLETATAIDALGDERIGARHFVANPEIVRLRRYRARTPAGARFLTLQLSSTGSLVGVIVEE